MAHFRGFQGARISIILEVRDDESGLQSIGFFRGEKR